MKKVISTLIFNLILLNIHAQSVDEKLKDLMIADGTLGNIENLIDQTIDYQKQMNPTVSENFWISLNTEVKKEVIPYFVDLALPIYKKTFSEDEIDKITTFYTSEVGKDLVAKQPEFIAELNIPIMQWSQNVNSKIIERIENRGNDLPTSSEIEKFEQDFKNQFGLQILNLSELTLDKEHNPGALLIDFGETDGTENITREIIVKNNTDSLLTFKKPLFLLGEDITFDWGDVPLKPNEKRALKFILNAKEAEGDRYSSMTIMVSQGQGFSVGVKYKAPQIEVEYSISKDSLSFEVFEGDFSKEYEFVIKNTGVKSFRIFDIELSKSIAYLYFNRDMVKPEDETKIKVLFSKDLVSDVKEVQLELKIKLTKSEDRGMHTFPNKTINVKIK